MIKKEIIEKYAKRLANVIHHKTYLGRDGWPLTLDFKEKQLILENTKILLQDIKKDLEIE